MLQWVHGLITQFTSPKFTQNKLQFIIIETTDYIVTWLHMQNTVCQY